MKYPKISVVLPTYNADKFLSQSLDSILNQTEDDFELLIIDDCSRDNTLSIINSYNDSRLKLISNTKRIGLANSLNLGISLSKGKYIARMDADDVSLPYRFEKQIISIEENNADICGCHYLIIDINEYIIEAKIVPIKLSDIILRIANEVPFAHGSIMLKRDSLISSNLNYSVISNTEDYLLWCEMYNNGLKFVNCDDILYKYRLHSNSISNDKFIKLRNESNNIRKKFIKKNQDTLFKLINIKLSLNTSNTNNFIDIFIPGFYISFLRLNFILFFSILKKSSLKQILFGLNRIFNFLL